MTMANTFEHIRKLYNNTCEDIVRSPTVWQNFLGSACYNFRLPFDEQLLIYAQRPDAKAVLSFNSWNNRFNRMVNRGAKGIAVVDDSTDNPRLKYYFDISDTSERENSKPVPIWKYQDSFKDDVIKTLQNAYDIASDDIYNAVWETSKTLVEDNINDYNVDLVMCKNDSFLEELSEDIAYKNGTFKLYDYPNLEPKAKQPSKFTKPAEKEKVDAETKPVVSEVDDGLDLIGEEIDIDGRHFVVDSVSNGYVSMADQTFANVSGFPIFRKETVEFVRQYLPTEKEQIIPTQNTKQHTEHSQWDIHPEIFVEQRHDFDFAAHPVEVVGKKERFRRNMEAIKVLKECEADTQRNAFKKHFRIHNTSKSFSA